jgi:hypothetical protein
MTDREQLLEELLGVHAARLLATMANAGLPSC